MKLVGEDNEETGMEWIGIVEKSGVKNMFPVEQSKIVDTMQRCMQRFLWSPNGCLSNKVGLFRSFSFLSAWLLSFVLCDAPKAATNETHGSSSIAY